MNGNVVSKLRGKVGHLHLLYGGPGATLAEVDAHLLPGLGMNISNSVGGTAPKD